MNLGANDGHTDYTVSCKRLATILGEEVLSEDDKVLACGCGYGAELIFWKNKYRLHHITGIDTNEDAVEKFSIRENIRLLNVPVKNILSRFQHRAVFNKIVSLDSIYHFPEKELFFSHCYQILSANPYDGDALLGKVGVTDLVLKEGVQKVPLWLRLALSAMNISVTNLWNRAVYILNPNIADSQNVSIKSWVMNGFWINGFQARF